MKKDRYDYMFEWLAERGPDEWHRVAMSSNWDGNDSVLAWIIDQPTCDKSTALSLFWLGSPEYFLMFKSREDLLTRQAYQIKNFDLLQKIVHNWKSGKYSAAQFATFDQMPEFMRGYPGKEKQIGEANLPWLIPDEMRIPINGQHLNWSDYSEGFAPELLARLEADNVKFWDERK